MARARNIKPGFFQNDELAELHPLERLAFIGMWTIADFKGCIEYRPKMLKVQILPYDDCDMEVVTNNLEQARFIRSYAVQGKRYLKIINFEKHQNPHKNERDAGSEIPDIDEQDETANKNSELSQDGTKPDLIGTARADSLVLIPDSLVLNPDTSAPAKPAMFDTFWSLWPATDRRTQRAKCKANWTKNNLDAKADEILEHVAALKKTEKWMSGFEPAPMTYLNGSQWEDGVPEIDRSTQQPKPQFLTAQQQRDENNRRSTAEFLADDTPFFGHQPIEGECSNA